MGRRYFRVRKAKQIDRKAMTQALIDELYKLQSDILGKFLDTTATWNHQPNWETDVVVTSSQAKVSVLTGDDQYVLVNEGAPSHAIFPVHAKALVFPGTFEPKSKPGVMKAYPGFSGPPIEVREWVAHPGFVARKFDEAVTKSIERTMEKRLDAIALKIAKASGHARG